MPNRNVYLPADLDEAFKSIAGELNFSQFVQEALRASIERQTRRCIRCGSELPRKEEVE